MDRIEFTLGDLLKAQRRARRIEDAQALSGELREVAIQCAELGIAPMMMATPITPASTFDTVIPVIDDGDAANRTTTVAMIQPLANRTEHLKDNKVDKVAAAESDLQDASAVSLRYSQPIIMTSNYAGNSGGGSIGFAFVQGIPGGQLQQGVNPDADDACIIPLANLPQQGTITSVEVYLKGASGHGSLPTMPRVTIGRKAKSSGAGFTSYGAKTDDAANVTAYQARHAVTPTLTGPIDIEDYDVCVQIQGESAIAGLQVESIIAVITPAKVTP